MMQHRVTIVVALALLVGVSGVAGQEIYRWRDERGVINFGNSPPAGFGAERQRLPTPRPTSLPVASDADEATPRYVTEEGTPPDPESPVVPSEAEIDPDQG